MVPSYLVALALLAAPALGAPHVLRSIERYAGKVVPDSYIVTLKKDAARKDIISELGISTNAEWDAVANGFAAKLDADTLNSLRASDLVENIAEDGIVTAFVTQTDAPWGIARLDQNGPVGGTASSLNFSYVYDASAGSGVDVYVIDTGILTSHTQLSGRAVWGATFGGYANADGNGHGTHCAGTIAGTRYGVAKSARVIAVKVLSDSGSGSTADVVSGMNYALSSAQSSGRPSVVSMSLGGGASTTIDNAVAALTNAGVHIAVAAGNSATNASGTSPARAPSAVTVGATTIADAIASYSNFGSVVDIFAPGSAVISSYIGSTSATASLSGTSMATPHVAGLIAYLISKDGNITPAAMSTKLKSLAVSGAISGIPSGTANLLANNV